MTLIIRLFFLFLVAIVLTFFSCSAQIDGVFRDGGSADLAIRTSLEPRTIALIRTLRNFMGEAADAPILDGPAISLSMEAAPGIRSVSLINTGPYALEGTISISNVEDFLANGGAKDRFITYNEGLGTGFSSIVIALDRDSAPELISRLSPEFEQYLSALMAPVVLGDASTRQEYLDLLASVYGRSLAAEIAAARIMAQIEFPRTVTALQGGTATGKLAEFDIPLLDILVLEQPLRYEVNW